MMTPFNKCRRWAWLGAAAWLGCAAGPTPREEADVHAAFAQIQVAEARLSRALAEAGTAGRACATRAAALHRAGQAVATLCEQARALGDADALDRCRQAQGQLDAARRGAPECGATGSP